MIQKQACRKRRRQEKAEVCAAFLHRDHKTVVCDITEHFSLTWLWEHKYGQRKPRPKEVLERGNKGANEMSKSRKNFLEQCTQKKMRKKKQFRKRKEKLKRATEECYEKAVKKNNKH